MAKQTRDKNQIFMIIGIISLIAGIVVAVIGIQQSVNDTMIYMIMEGIGAILILVGVTPIAMYFVNYRENHNGQSWSEHMEERLQKRMDELGDEMGTDPNDSPFSSIFGRRDDQTDAQNRNANQNQANVNAQPQGFRPPQGWIMADVVGITRNLRGSQNEQVEYYVICRYFDGVTRTYQTFTSKAMRDYPGKEIIGKRVRITFHSQDPTDYTVDMNTIE